MTTQPAGILLDIEGTTSSIRFVYDSMFPYARRELQPFLTSSWDHPDVQRACTQLAADATSKSWQEWCGADDALTCRKRMIELVLQLMDEDSKATGLKDLQGQIWAAGFSSGELVAHVYDDVVPALQHWTRLGADVRIYSSGSIPAQKLFFGHTQVGNLLHYFREHYDTTSGPKQLPQSYQFIASQFGAPPQDLLFVSDVVDELNAARQAGWTTALCCRPGNTLPSIDQPHRIIHSFAEIQVA